MSKIEVNTVDVQCGSTLTLGSSGKTVALATGASQTGFGRTGTVNWCTTAKTSPFTATSGSGFFVNTTSGAVTVTLPSSPSAGDIVSIADYAGTAATACKEIIIGRGGSKFQGVCNCGLLNEERESVTLIYVDGTQGWVPVHDQVGTKENKEYIAATGGTVATVGDFKIHSFTGNGCFAVSAGGNAAGSNTVDYLVVAGGGGGGPGCGGGVGGGGAGGLRIGSVCSPGSPPLVAAGLPVSAQTYPITIGAGGASHAAGNPSVFSTITSAAGGQGGPSGDGGSGGGGTAPGSGGNVAGGDGNTPSVSPPQGNNGGNGTATGGQLFAGGGGGGATAVGTSGTFPVSGPGGAGGAGLTVTPVFGSAPQPFYIADGPGTTGPSVGGIFAGGGGGGSGRYAPGPGGFNGGAGADGGGGDGSTLRGGSTAGVANTGGGGGGGGYNQPGCGVSGGTGGSGYVLIRYKFQN